MTSVLHYIGWTSLRIIKEESYCIYRWTQLFKAFPHMSRIFDPDYSGKSRTVITNFNATKLEVDA